VLVEREVHDAFVTALVAAVAELYGPDPRTSPDYARIVSDAHVQRLASLLHAGAVACGGVVDAAARYVAPTVLTGIGRGDPCMAEEIFGPILPVLAVDSLPEAVAIVNDGDKPLALYVFSERDSEVDQVVAGTSSGGVCVNGTILHIVNPHLPFGGVGPSGMGAYHGRVGFDRLSHQRAVYERSTRIDPDLLYPPYTATKQKLIRRGLGLPDPRELPARLTAAVRTRRADRH
jgi:aldehyde dehydrogenase (NAD+)